MPKVELFNREEVLDKALNLFWEKGFDATSLSDLTKELGIGKGSFYNSFGSKRALFDNCLVMYSQRGHKLLEQNLYKYEDPIEGIKNLLDKHVDFLLNDNLSRGCFIVNSSTEMANDIDIKKLLSSNNQNMKSILVRYFKEKKLSKDANKIADTLIIHLTGISVMSKFIDNKERYNTTNEFFIESLLQKEN